MQHPNGESFQINLDIHEQRLDITTVSGSQRAMELGPMPVPEFYRGLMALLDDLGLHTDIWPMPVEIPGRFGSIGTICTAPTNQHGRTGSGMRWSRCCRCSPEFRARFLGKASPIHLFWGGLDLATTRFSGRTAPPHLGRAPNCGPHVMAEAYSHEVSSCGYWPDGGPEGVFYSYAYPTPPGFADAAAAVMVSVLLAGGERAVWALGALRRRIDPRVWPRRPSPPPRLR
jgi:hypothetical protein